MDTCARRNRWGLYHKSKVGVASFGAYASCVDGGYWMKINKAGDPVGSMHFSCAQDGVDCEVPIRYMQFVHTDLVSGICYYYEAGSSSGKSGQHTWRYDP